MFRNYFNTAIRNLRKHPLHSLLNVTGLALGITCAALILLWVDDELSWNNQVPNRDRIFMARLNMPYQGSVTSFTGVPGPLGPAAQKTVPGILRSFRYSDGGHRLFTVGDKSLYEDGTYADSGFFDITKIPFIKGSPTGCLSRLHSIVITQSTAKKYFGDDDPMGKTMRMDNSINYTVTGVVPDFPPNYSLGFHWMADFEDFLVGDHFLRDWGNLGRPLVFELAPGVDPNAVAKKLTALIRPKDKAYAQVDMLLWPMKDWHLYNNFTNGKPDGGQIKFVKLFSLIASIILLIACINFMNLATARAGQWAREVGVRKTLGALKQSLVSRFIAESLLLSFLSVALAVGLIYIVLPPFNTLVGKALSFHPLDPAQLLGLISIGAICGLLSGSYPAFYLSSFNPVTVLKGMNINRGGAGFIRKALVTAQFAASVILIICTIIIYQQIRHIKDRDLGMNKQNLAFLDVQGNMGVHYEAIRSDLLATRAVDQVAISFSSPLSMWGGTDNTHLLWDGDDISSKEYINQELISPGYLATMGLTLKEGRDFYPEGNADTASVLINERFARLMGKAGKIGSRIRSTDGDGTKTIVGIIHNFVFNDMYGTPAPLMLYCNPQAYKYAHSLNMRLRPGVNTSAAIDKITAVIKADNPGFPVDVKFADVEFQHQFDYETEIGTLAGLFATLAIVISCLGLSGLAAYTAEQRTKELGIRKVLGAPVSGLAGLLSREFLALVALSCLIAFPFSWWAMYDWLSSYAYRTPINWWVFAAAGLGALLIALCTVVAQALKAAMANPVKTLRSEG